MYQFQYIKENQLKLSQIFSYRIIFQGTQIRVRNSRGEEAIGVRATEVLLLYQPAIAAMHGPHSLVRFGD